MKYLNKTSVLYIPLRHANAALLKAKLYAGVQISQKFRHLNQIDEKKRNGFIRCELQVAQMSKVISIYLHSLRRLHGVWRWEWMGTWQFYPRWRIITANMKDLWHLTRLINDVC